MIRDGSENVDTDSSAKFEPKRTRGGPTLIAIIILLVAGLEFFFGKRDSTTGYFKPLLLRHYVYIAVLLGLVAALVYSDWKPTRKPPANQQ
jgi:hypothetical protein